MLKTSLFLLFIFFIACKNNNTEAKINDSSTQANINKTAVEIVRAICDSTISYDLENISSEGSEAQVCYVNHKINKAKILIYGAAGRVEIYYIFNGITVEATERDYEYKKSLSEIKSDNDIKILDSSNYVLSFHDGEIQKGKITSHAKEIYNIFLKTVPLTIK